MGAPVDDAHGVRVGQRLAHLVQVQECLMGEVLGGTGAGAAWLRGEHLLVGEVRAMQPTTSADTTLSLAASSSVTPQLFK